jgi:DNA-binding CsgD family transcriptional regulator
MEPRQNNPHTDVLSPFELDVVRLAASGETMSSAARKMGKSAKTTDGAMRRVLAKWDLSTRADVIAEAHRRGLLAR